MTRLTTQWISFASPLKRPLALLSLAACLALFPSVEVQATGGAWGSHGSTGSMASSGGSWGSSGGTTVARRPVRNLLGRICDRITSIGSGSRGSHGSSGGSYGSSGGRVYRYSSHGSSGGSSGYVTYGSSGGSHGSSGGYSSLALSAPQYSAYGNGLMLDSSYAVGDYSLNASGSLNDLCCNGVLAGSSMSGPATPMTGVDAQGRVLDGGSIDSMLENGGASPEGQYYEPKLPPANAAPNPGPETGNDSTHLPVAPTENRAVLSLSVPAEAKVYINDRLTQTKGDLRNYESANLNQDRDYHYVVKAELVRDGKRLVRTQMVSLRPGTQKTVALDFDSPAITTLALQVPENATVTLCGKPTELTGSERKFVTAALADGEQCDGYTIEVAYPRDGEIVKDLRTIDLVAGDLLNLTFGQPVAPTTRIASN